jgi:HSP20 family molecular chaperone IbpA
LARSVSAVRAEIPGVDPARDIRIRLAGDVLRVDVTRAPSRADQIRSEFHYGRLIGAVGLPSDVDGHQLAARYHHGVLTIASPTVSTVGNPVTIGPEDNPEVTVRPASARIEPATPRGWDQ